MPFFAFFSKKAYREVGKNWRGINLAYLFLLIAVCCLPPAIILHDTMISHLDSHQQYLASQIPDIQIDHGQVMIDQHQPYYITRRDGSPAVIIDTTGSMNYIDDPRVFALLMESSLIVRNGTRGFRTIDLSSIDGFHLDSYIASSWLAITKDALIPVSYSIFLVASYLFAVFVMLLVAIIGLIMSTIMRGPLSFGCALRIATVAATPSILFIAFSTTMGFAVPTLIHVGVTLIYLFIGIKACARPTDEEHVDLKSCLQEENTSVLRQEAA